MADADLSHGYLSRRRLAPPMSRRRRGACRSRKSARCYCALPRLLMGAPAAIAPATSAVAVAELMPGSFTYSAALSPFYFFARLPIRHVSRSLVLV